MTDKVLPAWVEGLKRFRLNAISGEWVKWADLVQACPPHWEPQLLERFREHILSHGLCHGEDCGDDPTLGPIERRAFIEAHQDICTCGTDEVFALAERLEAAALPGAVPAQEKEVIE